MTCLYINVICYIICHQFSEKIDDLLVLCFAEV